MALTTPAREAGPPGAEQNPATPGGHWLYLLLFAAQALGVAIIFANGVPLYRQLSGDPDSYPAEVAESRLWAVFAVVLVQVAYWTRHQLRPQMPHAHAPVLGHIIGFAGRMTFALATTIFGFVFLQQRLASQMPWQRYILTIFVLFSLFCFLLESLHLGKWLEDYPKNRAS